jgi:hypothetical protein
MIMAERAADCLAKLGLDGHHHGGGGNGQQQQQQQQIPITTTIAATNGFLNLNNGGGTTTTATTTTTITVPDGSSGASPCSVGIWNTFGGGGGGYSSVASSTLPQSQASSVVSPPPAKREPLRVLGGGLSPSDKLDSTISPPGSISPNGGICPFNAPHHRRYILIVDTISLIFVVVDRKAYENVRVLTSAWSVFPVDLLRARRPFRGRL